MKKNLSYIIISLLIGYSQLMEAQQNENLTYEINADSVKRFAIKEQKVIAIRISSDTLCIVSTNEALYYPFGIFSNFAVYYSECLKNSVYEYTIDSAFNLFKIIIVHSEYSELKFIENFETKRLELLSGFIRDESFSLFNSIRIGMDKTELLQRFLTYIPKEIMDKQVIELKSGLEGVWYYYSFSNNILNEIDIKTDYILSK